MYEKSKIYILALCILIILGIILFWITSTVEAAIFFTQPHQDASTGLGINAPMLQSLGSPLLPYILNNIKLEGYAYDQYQNNTADLRIVLLTTTSSISNCEAYQTGNPIRGVMWENGIGGTYNNTPLIWDFANPENSYPIGAINFYNPTYPTGTVILDPNLYYYLSIHNGYGGQFKGNSIDEYKTGALNHVDSGCPEYDNVRDLFFVANTNTTSSPETEYISLLHPKNGDNIEDFFSWVIRIDNTKQNTNYYVKINYHSSSTDPYYNFSDYSYIYTDEDDVIIQYLEIYKSQPLFQKAGHETGIWSAQAQLYSDRDYKNLIHSSNFQNFYIYAYDTVEKSTSTAGILAGRATDFFDKVKKPKDDCSQFSGGLFSSSTLQALSCYAKYTVIAIGEFMFYPSTSTLLYFSESFTELKGKFPFNIVFDLSNTTKNSLQNITSSTSQNYETNIILNGKTINLISSSTLNVMGSTTKNVFFQLITAIAYVGAGWVIFSMITKHKI